MMQAMGASLLPRWSSRSKVVVGRALTIIACLAMYCAGAAAEPPSLRIATFEVDATPPLGSPLCDGLVKPAARIEDRLSCRGLVLLGAGDPIVLCVLDWAGIGNGAHDEWRRALAAAAQTKPDRVAVHVTHAHDAPGGDSDAAALLEPHGITSHAFDPPFLRETIDAAAAALGRALAQAAAVTHIGYGKAQVEQVASSRRMLGPDGRVRWVRYSATRDPEARAQPEGTIDPYLYLVSFWRDDEPVAAMSYYACHPQSHYGKGAVSCDFPGLARNRFQAKIGIPLLHFNGAGGNVTAGKYNDGDPVNRDVLAGRLERGMSDAWRATKKSLVGASDIRWHIVPVALPPASYLDEQSLRSTLADPKRSTRERVRAARNLAWLERCNSGLKIELTCLSAGPVRILHMPGELFVEYQLAAQQFRPDLFVTMAAYGDYGMGYIGTKIAYSQGGYEVQENISLVAPQVEEVLMPAIRELVR